MISFLVKKDCQLSYCKDYIILVNKTINNGVKCRNKQKENIVLKLKKKISNAFL